MGKVKKGGNIMQFRIFTTLRQPPGRDAQADPSVFPVQPEPLAEQVEVEPAAGLVVGVAHIVPEGRPPHGDLTVFAHGSPGTL